MENDKAAPASWHGAKMDFSQAMSYGDYLALDQILSAQHSRSPNPNEMLFIVQHQTSELWLKLMLHELHAVRAHMHAGDLPPAFKMLAREGFAIDAERLAGDWTVATTANESVKAAWLQVYQEPTRHWALYELAEKLVDLETAFRYWRFKHVTTVERVIGFKAGTGGTAGVSYLRKMLDVVLFPELFSLRTAL